MSRLFDRKRVQIGWRYIVKQIIFQWRHTWPLLKIHHSCNIHWSTVLSSFEVPSECLLVENIQFYIYSDSAYLSRLEKQRSFQTKMATWGEEDITLTKSCDHVTIEHKYKAAIKDVYKKILNFLRLSQPRSPDCLLYTIFTLVLTRMLEYVNYFAQLQHVKLSTFLCISIIVLFRHSCASPLSYPLFFLVVYGFASLLHVLVEESTVQVQLHTSAIYLSWSQQLFMQFLLPYF